MKKLIDLLCFPGTMISCMTRLRLMLAHKAREGFSVAGEKCACDPSTDASLEDRFTRSLCTNVECAQKYAQQKKIY